MENSPKIGYIKIGINGQIALLDTVFLKIVQNLNPELFLNKFFEVF